MSFHAIDRNGLLPQLEVSVDVTNVPTGVTRTWTDVTTDLRASTPLSYTLAGRNDELQTTTGGTFTGVFNNRAGKYDPTNGAGVGLKRGQWIRVRGQWNSVAYPRWQGIITSIVQSYPESGKDAVTTVQAMDVMKIAGLYDLATNTFAAQRSDVRAAAIATLIGLTLVADDNGASTLVAVAGALSVGSIALNYLEQIEQTENGLIFADASGNLRFQSRHYRLLNSATAVATIGESAGEIPYRSVEVNIDDSYIYNDVMVTPTNADGSAGTTQTAVNSSSQSLYFKRALARTILSSDTTEALSCAQFLTSVYGDPAPRIPAVELMGVRATSKWPTILSIVNSQRFTFKRRAAVTISQDVYVERVSETIVAGAEWRTTLQLSPAVDRLGWVLGSAVYSKLGQTTAVTY